MKELSAFATRLSPESEGWSYGSLSSIVLRVVPSFSGIKDLNKVFELATAYKIQDWLVFDPSVVRGLSYYTGIVFEGFDKSGELRAICGGGRYDQLLSSMAGEIS
jgi:histidyl-tRNA synthetase